MMEMYGILQIMQIIGIVAVIAGILLIIAGIFEKPEFHEYRVQEPDYAPVYRDFELNPEYPERSDKRDRGRGEREDREDRVKTEFGGVVMIGPIPIVFGNNTRAATLAIVLTMVLMLLAFLLFVFPRF